MFLANWFFTEIGWSEMDVFIQGALVGSLLLAILAACIAPSDEKGRAGTAFGLLMIAGGLVVIVYYTQSKSMGFLEFFRKFNRRSIAVSAPLLVGAVTFAVGLVRARRSRRRRRKRRS